MTTQRLASGIGALLLVASFSGFAQQSAPVFDGRMRPAASGTREAYLQPAGATAHAANLLTLRNGDTLCVWFAGTREGQSGVAIFFLPFAQRIQAVVGTIPHRSAGRGQLPESRRVRSSRQHPVGDPYDAACG